MTYSNTTGFSSVVTSQSCHDFRMKPFHVAALQPCLGARKESLNLSIIPAAQVVVQVSGIEIRRRKVLGSGAVITLIHAKLLENPSRYVESEICQACDYHSFKTG